MLCGCSGGDFAAHARLALVQVVHSVLHSRHSKGSTAVSISLQALQRALVQVMHSGLHSRHSRHGR